MYSNAPIRGPGVPSLSFRILSEQQNHQKWDGIRDLLGVLDIVPVWELVKQFMYGCCFCIWCWTWSEQGVGKERWMGSRQEQGQSRIQEDILEPKDELKIEIICHHCPSFNLDEAVDLQERLTLFRILKMHLSHVWEKPKEIRQKPTSWMSIFTTA